MNRGRHAARAFRHCAPRGHGKAKGEARRSASQETWSRAVLDSISVTEIPARAHAGRSPMHLLTPSPARPARARSVSAVHRVCSAARAARARRQASCPPTPQTCAGSSPTRKDAPSASVRVAVVGPLGARTVYTDADGRFDVAEPAGRDLSAARRRARACTAQRSRRRSPPTRSARSTCRSRSVPSRSRWSCRPRRSKRRWRT